MKNSGGRSPSESFDRALREAVRRTLSKIGGVRIAADMTRAYPSQFSRYTTPGSGVFIPLDIAAVIDEPAGDLILREWAQQRGYRLLKTETILEADRLETEIGSCALECGELVNAGLVAVSDGKLTPREGREVMQAATDVEDKIIVIKQTAAKAMAGAAR